jgi:hypothetical protein
VITGYSLSLNHQRLATVSSSDKFIKIFDVMGFDMINMTKLNFTPYCCQYIEKEQSKLSMIAM